MLSRFFFRLQGMRECSGQVGPWSPHEGGAVTPTPDTAGSRTGGQGIRSLIPARIDRLPWSRFHPRLVTALGVAWVLDGLEITIAANVVPDLTDKTTLHLTTSQSG